MSLGKEFPLVFFHSICKDVKYEQVIGWSMWFSEYLFLERSWAKDEGTIKVWFCKFAPSLHIHGYFLVADTLFSIHLFVYI